MKHAIFAFSFFVLVAPAAWADPTAPRPDVRVGDRWSFRQTDGITGDPQGEFTRRVVNVSPTEITTATQVRGRAGQTLSYFTRDWNVEDNGISRFEPALLTLRFPMKTGDSWRGEYTIRNLANGSAVKCAASIKVTGYESVTVPAGKYDAFNIETHRECLPVGGAGAPVQSVNHEWYAPAVRFTVKSVSSAMFQGRERSRTVVEMTEYMLADSTDTPPPPPAKGPEPSSPSAVPSVGGSPKGNGI